MTLASSDLERTIYIGNLHEEVSDEILYQIFIPFGEIKSIEIPKDIETGSLRGFGFVEYEELEDAEQALDNRHQSELFGKTIKVQRAKKMKGPLNKPIWQDKDYQIKYIKNQDEDVQELNEELENEGLEQEDANQDEGENQKPQEGEQ